MRSQHWYWLCVRYFVVVSLVVSVIGVGARYVYAATPTPGPGSPALGHKGPLPPPSSFPKPVNDPRVYGNAPPLDVAGSDATYYAERNLPDVFGGVWMDENANIIHVLLKDTSAATTGKIMQNTRHADRLVFDKAKFSRKELRALQARLTADHGMLQGRGINVVAVGEKTDINKLHVSVLSSTAAITNMANITLGQLYGADAVTVEGVANAPRKTDRVNGGYPYVGGYLLTDITGNNHTCTLGFVAFSYQPSEWAVLTAGHCYVMDQAVVHPGTGVVGNVDKNIDVDGSSADAETIGILGDETHLSDYMITADPYEGTVQYSETTPMVGAGVCKSGWKTDLTCGTVTEINIDFDSGVRIHGVVAASAGGTQMVDMGDSGGSVFKFLGNGYVSAEGIVLGENDASGSILYYSHISNVCALQGLNCHVLSSTGN